MSRPNKLFTEKQYARIKKENGLVSYDGTNLKDANGNTIEVGGGGSGETNYYISGQLNDVDAVTLYDGIDTILYQTYEIHLNDLPLNTKFKFIGCMQGEGGGYIVNAIKVITGVNGPAIEVYGINLGSGVVVTIESETDAIKRETLTETIIQSTIWLSVPSE